jgi:hypothetical protein
MAGYPLAPVGAVGLSVLVDRHEMTLPLYRIASRHLRGSDSAGARIDDSVDERS